MDHATYDDAYIADILGSVRTIAVVGASAKPDRPSHHVMETLIDHGYRVHPINPGLAGTTIHGRTVVASLAEVPEAIDMVDVFRAVDAVPGIVDEALALPQRPGVLWTQLGIRDDDAAARAEAAGMRVVMDRCPAIELPRLRHLMPAKVSDA